MIFQSDNHATASLLSRNPCGELQGLLGPLEKADTDLSAGIETGKSYLKLLFLKSCVRYKKKEEKERVGCLYGKTRF